MATAALTTTASRRRFLSFLGFASASSVIPAVLAQDAKVTGRFANPSEYLAAMQAIGWRPVAMFQRLRDGSIHRMGVSETRPDKARHETSFLEFHAIQIRVPVQMGNGADWWQQVWTHLYDKGLREDVTPARSI